jgi:hypothetical protein
MSTRRRGVPPPKPGLTGYNFTLLDELRASPDHPMPERDAARRVAEVRKNLDALAHGTQPDKVNWRLVALAGNILEVMRELDMINDPDDLLADSFGVLRSVAEYATQHGVPPRLVGAEIAIVDGMVQAFADALAGLPHRTVIRAMRETDKRMRVLRPTDYDANPNKRRKV